MRRTYLTLFRYLPVRLRRQIARMFGVTFSVGSAVVLVDCDGSVLALVQRHKSGLSLPGGLVRRKEAPRTALIREVWEELRIVLDPAEYPDYVLCDPSRDRIAGASEAGSSGRGLLSAVTGSPLLGPSTPVQPRQDV